MAYGLRTRAFVEDGPVEQVAKADTIRSTARAWQALSEACRLEVVEQALRVPAHDRGSRTDWSAARPDREQDKRGKDGHHGR